MIDVVEKNRCILLMMGCDVLLNRSVECQDCNLPVVLDQLIMWLITVLKSPPIMTSTAIAASSITLGFGSDHLMIGCSALTPTSLAVLDLLETS